VGLRLAHTAFNLRLRRRHGAKGRQLWCTRSIVGRSRIIGVHGSRISEGNIISHFFNNHLSISCSDCLFNQFTNSNGTSTASATTVAPILTRSSADINASVTASSELRRRGVGLKRSTLRQRRRIHVSISMTFSGSATKPDCGFIWFNGRKNPDCEHVHNIERDYSWKIAKDTGECAQ